MTLTSIVWCVPCISIYKSIRFLLSFFFRTLSAHRLQTRRHRLRCVRLRPQLQAPPLPPPHRALTSSLSKSSRRNPTGTHAREMPVWPRLFPCDSWSIVVFPQHSGVAISCRLSDKADAQRRVCCYFNSHLLSPR